MKNTTKKIVLSLAVASSLHLFGADYFKLNIKKREINR